MAFSGAKSTMTLVRLEREDAAQQILCKVLPPLLPVYNNGNDSKIIILTREEENVLNFQTR